MIIWEGHLRRKASLRRGVTDKDTIACFLEMAQLIHISLLCESYKGLHGMGVLAWLGWIATKGELGMMNQ